MVSGSSCLSASEYQCDSGQCISADDVCDGIGQCADQSDELYCRMSLSSSSCLSLSVCLYVSLLLGGILRKFLWLACLSVCRFLLCSWQFNSDLCQNIPAGSQGSRKKLINFRESGSTFSWDVGQCLKTLFHHNLWYVCGIKFKRLQITRSPPLTSFLPFFFPFPPLLLSPIPTALYPVMPFFTPLCTFLTLPYLYFPQHPLTIPLPFHLASFTPFATSLNFG